MKSVSLNTEDMKFETFWKRAWE